MLEQLQTAFPQLTFVADTRYCWSPTTQAIHYDARRDDEAADWSLLHEAGHALLEHNGYLADFELIKLEMAAWTKARELAQRFAVVIDEDHVQDCLDTYRDWLYTRSICPQCSTKALQQQDYEHYRCYNCHARWHVTPSRFCRAYRATKRVPSKKQTARELVFSIEM